MRSNLSWKTGRVERPENRKTGKPEKSLFSQPARQNLQNRCSGSTKPSKTLLRLNKTFKIAIPARQCLRNDCSGSTVPSKSLLRPFEITAPARLCLRNYCSGSTVPSKLLLQLDCAFEITAPARLWFRNHCSGSTVLSKSLLKLDCAFRNRSASNCALLRALLCSTSQAP